MTSNRFTHGHAWPPSPTYQSWLAMKKRCLKITDKDYHRYGGRGITICSRWIDSFENFLEDMKERPPGKTLHRPNDAMIYSPDTCVWADAKTQSNERRLPKYDYSNPSRHIRHRTDIGDKQYEVRMTIIPYSHKSCSYMTFTYEEAEELRSLLEYEREVNKLLLFNNQAQSSDVLLK